MNKVCRILTVLAWLLFHPEAARAQVIIDDEQQKFRISGYLRTGIGLSEGGETQAHFQMPGALNKFSLGNQADTYGELEFDYTYKFSRDRSIDAIWMVSFYEDFGTQSKMSFNKSEQLYFRFNNFFMRGETIWVGERFYDRYAIHLLDRQWINPGQKGLGFGMEGLLQKGTKEDIKWGVWRLRRKNVISPYNGAEGKVYNYTADLRWVHHPINENMNINFAINYTLRPRQKELGYETKHGFGLFSWLDYEKKDITNTVALLLRQGANIPLDHWSGTAEIENPLNNDIILNDLSKAFSLELNNNFLYDNFETWAVNAIMVGVIRNHGTAPYVYDSNDLLAALTPTALNQPSGYGDGKMFYWLALGVRPIYYIIDQFRLSLELTQEFVQNKQLGVAGNMTKITFSPEFALKKGFYSRPVLRPAFTYARWSSGLRGYIGGVPEGAPYANKTNGYTFSLQFETWW